MMRTQTGTAQWNKLVNSKTNIQLDINSATIKNGNSYRLGRMYPGSATIDAKGNVEMISAKIVIYEGTIKQFMKDSKNRQNTKSQAYHDNTKTTDERIAAVAGHEAEHTTTKNVTENYENQTKGTTHDLEKDPDAKEMQILKETGENHPDKLTPLPAYVK